VVNYLMVARDVDGDVGQRANAYFEELREIDPAAVKQAESYAAFGQLASRAKDPSPGAARPPKDAANGKKPTKDAIAADKQAARKAAIEADPAPSLEPNAPIATPLADEANRPTTKPKESTPLPTKDEIARPARPLSKITSRKPGAPSPQAVATAAEAPSGSTRLSTGIAVGLVVVFVTMVFSIGGGRP
jgi:hypothetical protein